MRRRRLLGWLAIGSGALLTGLVAVPVLGHLLSPLVRSRADDDGGFIPVGTLDDFPADRPVRVTFPVTVRDGWETVTARQAAWVRRRSDGTVSVLSTVCPHLGCSIRWSDGGDHFECPCHDSAFAPDGARQAGPSRRGMDELPARVRGDRVELRWIEYAAGSAERRPLRGAAG